MLDRREIKEGNPYQSIGIHWVEITILRSALCGMNAPVMSRDDSPTEADASEPEAPTLADRVEASDDFGAALQQSTSLIAQDRRIVLILMLVGALLVGIVIVYPRLLG